MTVTNILLDVTGEVHGDSGSLGEGHSGGQNRLSDLTVAQYDNCHGCEVRKIVLLWLYVPIPTRWHSCSILMGRWSTASISMSLAWREATQAAGIELPVWRIHRQIGMSGGLMLNALLRETGRPVSKEDGSHSARARRGLCQASPFAPGPTGRA